MQNPLIIANKILLEPAGLTQQDLVKALQLASTSGYVDDADIYLQYLQSEGWGIEDSIIKGGSFSIDQGFSVRALSGEKTGFAYADDINVAALRQTACAAGDIAVSSSDGGRRKINLQVNRNPRVVFSLGLYPFTNPLQSISEEEKVNVLRRIDQEARRQDPRVVQVIASLAGLYEVVLLMSASGNLTADVRPLVRVNVVAIVEENHRREKGSAGGGARCNYNLFLQHDGEKILYYAREAVRLALLNLHAQAAPAGAMPVVLGCGWPAVLLHEAVGHGLEGDFIRKKSSVYAGKVGTKVAAPGCTIIDQGNLPGERRGSLHVDDEGTPTQCNVLIEDGILYGYMQDKLNARLLGTSSTGNARRESYAYAPLPRMTNTYMLGGDYAAEEIIASVDRGLYAANLSGGQVDITSGEFVFTTSEAYLIEKGKITAPVKHATLIGNGPAILHKIAMVGNDLQFDHGVGMCGKGGQSVPVGVGQPTVKVSEMVVGGSAAVAA
jgi:TldD protein